MWIDGPTHQPMIWWVKLDCKIYDSP